MITKRTVVLFAAAATALVIGSILFHWSDLALAAAVAGGKAILANPPALASVGGNMKALLERRATLIGDMASMLNAAEAEDRDLTAEEITKYDALKAEKVKLDERIARLDDVGAAQAHLAAPRHAVAAQIGLTRPPAPEAKREFESVGEFLAAVRFNQNDQRLNYVENASANSDELRAEMRMDDGPSGGFAIPPQFRDKLLTLTPQQAIIRPRAAVLPGTGSAPDAPVTMPALDQTGSAPGNWFGGVQVAWIAEGGTKPATDMKLRDVTLTPHEVAGVMTVTDKLLRNWSSSSALIETQLRGAVAQAEDYAFLAGNGVGKPLGILKAGATYKVARAVANQIGYNDAAEMMARSYGNGVFVYSRSALAYLMKLKDTLGRPLWVSSMREGEPDSLLGRPAILSDRNPQLGSLGDLWYGDLSQYLIKDGSGPFVAASEHVLFQQNKTMIKIFWNTDGAPWLTAPITLENGYQVSPFVALDVPAA